MNKKLVYVVHATKICCNNFGSYIGDKRKNLTDLFCTLTDDDDNKLIGLYSTVDKAVECRKKFIRKYHLLEATQDEMFRYVDFGYPRKHAYIDNYGNMVAISIHAMYLDSENVVYLPLNDELD